MANLLSEQFKADAAGLVVKGGSVSERSKLLGIGSSTLDKRVRSAKNTAGESAFVTLTAEQKRLLELEKENAHLREINEVFKKDDDTYCQRSKTVKYSFIKAYFNQFTMCAMCEALRVSRSGFYAWQSNAGKCPLLDQAIVKALPYRCT